MFVNSLAVAAMIVTGGWLYGSTWKGLGAEWASSPDSSYGLVLAAVAIAVFLHRRRMIAKVADSRTPPAAGALVFCGGLAIYLVGIFGADVFLTRVSAIVVIAGLVRLLAGSRALRVALAPLTFLLIAVPLPALIVNAVTLPLQLVASRIAETSMMAAGVPVYRDGNLLALPSVTLEVADACSGLRSLISLVAIAAVVAWAEHRTAGRRVAVIASAVPIAIVMNGLRIAVTGVACEWWSPRAAAGGWHTFEGWITFVASVGALLAMSNFTKMPERRRREALRLQASVAGANAGDVRVAI
jgi:exosortase